MLSIPMPPPDQQGRPLWVAVAVLPAGAVAGILVGLGLDQLCETGRTWTAILGILAPIAGLADIIRKGIR